MNDNRFKAWAERRGGGGYSGRAGAPRGRSEPDAVVSPPGVAPSGFAWASTAHGWVLIQVGQAPVAPPALPRQPQAVTPYGSGVPVMAAPVSPGQPGRVIPFPTTRTCELVKPGDRDPYAELLAQVPDLAPPSNGYDAMAGNSAPEVQEELRRAASAGLIQGSHGALDDVYPRGAPTATKVGDLRAGAAPKE